ncbi:MAG: nicotinate-nucleotide adenylyltransferase [Vampirovibrionales bacterium]|nr:nicotinate-nucleotide adenylyltransferase [Vampirovibrionales bacterium]
MHCNTRTGYFFGTFNPPHMGHLMLAECARQQFSLERVVFVPSGKPPNRLSDTSLAPAQDRLEMVRRATAHHPAFSVWSGEITHASPSYTVESLEALGAFSPEAICYMILGADTLTSVPSWHRAESLMAHCQFLSAWRKSINGFEESFSHPAMVIHWLDMPLISISATAIRARVAQGLSIRYWVPEWVRHYIEDNRLYSSYERKG